MTRFIMGLLSIVCLASCFDGPTDRFSVFENYYVYSDNGKDYVFMCKLSCDSDPVIEGVTSVAWNDQIIIVQSGEESNSRFYLIKASGSELACCNKDVVSGPMSEIQIDSAKRVLGITTKLKKKVFVHS